MLQLAISAGLKLHIVSAGIKGVVTETFYILQMQRGMDAGNSLVYCMTPEIYDAENLLIGFTEPTIITTNKHLFVRHDNYPEIKEGDNAIVMGDLVEDYMIVKNLKLSNVIGVGFFNGNARLEPEQLHKYMETYDIVISNDGNLIHVVELIKSIIGATNDPEYLNYSPSTKQFATLLK